MIRVSQAQLTLLERNLTAARSSNQAPASVTVRRRREDLPENVLEQQIRDFLAWHGFISIRQHVGTFLPFRVVKQLQAGQISFDQALRNVVRIGEEGAADWWSARPIIPPGGRALDGPHPWAAFYWECKAPNKRPTDAQLAWMEKRRQVGIEATWFNQFAAGDRPSPACEPRESYVFEVWFFQYFAKLAKEETQLVFRASETHADRC
jgi:hypothetical protein